jgi:homoserine acetyltransferase
VRAGKSSILLRILSAFAAAPNQQVAQLGDLRLESGEVIRDCRIGYRTVGRLDSSKSTLYSTDAAVTKRRVANRKSSGRSWRISWPAS